MVRSRYPRGAVEVRLWCASGSVRLVNFSTGDTVRTCRGMFWGMHCDMYLSDVGRNCYSYFGSVCSSEWKEMLPCP